MVKKIAVAAAFLAAVVGATPATSAAPSLSPHIWSTKISGPTPLLKATWRLAFQTPAYNVTRNGGVVVAGTVRIVGNKVTFHDLAGIFACRGATRINGSYTWRIQGAKLTFTRLSDACPGRKGVLSHAFTRIA
jgi:hypothetical protein